MAPIESSITSQTNESPPSARPGETRSERKGLTGLSPQVVKEPRPSWNDLSGWMQRLQRVSLTERAIFTQNLYIMIKSGVPLAQALGTLARQTRNKRFLMVLETMKTRIEKGEPFAKVLASYPRHFSEVYTSMVAAGEASGRLESILSQLTIQLKKERVLIAKIRGAMFYPVLVLFAMLLIGGAMMVFVIPNISAIYLESGVVLPLPTRVLIGISTFITNNGLLVLGVMIVLGIFARRFFRTRRGKRLLHGMILRTPILNTIVKKINLARFSRTLHSLLQTDIPIVQSFQIIQRTLSNVYYQEAVGESAQLLGKGITVVQALQKKPKLFPPMVTQMISVGEESGTLDELSNEIAIFYEEDVDETMTNFSSIIEPVLLLLLGVGVAGMAISVLLPMYSLTEQI